MREPEEHSGAALSDTALTQSAPRLAPSTRRLEQGV